MKQRHMLLSLLAFMAWLCPALAGGTPGKCPDENTLTRDARIALVEAQKFMNQKKMTDARLTLETFVSDHPDESHAYVAYTLAGLYLENNKMTDARDQYEKTLDFCPAYAPAWQNLGKVSYDLGQFSRAAFALERTWELTGKKRHTLKFYAAVAHVSDKAPDRALPHLEFLCSGLAGNPKETWVKLLVQLSMEQKQSKKALKTVEDLLTRPVPSPYLFRLAATLNLDRGQHKKAARNLNAYSLMVPLSPAEQRLLADLYSNLGIPARAAQNYEKTIELKPSRKTYERLASAWFEACEQEKALAAAAKGLETYPASHALWKLAGWIHYKKKAFRRASHAFGKAAVLNKKDTKSLFMHGLSACRAGDRNSAKKALEKAACHANYKTRALGLIRQMETNAEKS